MQGSAEAVASLNVAPWRYWVACPASAIVRGHFGPSGWRVSLLLEAASAGKA